MTRAARIPPGVAALASAIALAAVAAAAVRFWDWPIEVVRVDGRVVHTDRQRLKDTVALHTRAGFFGMDLEALQGRVERLPWVRSAELRRVWPETLRVRIVEHEAVARWNGQALVNRAGTVFEPETVATDNLPRLSGPDGRAAAMLERLRAAQSALERIEPTVVALRQDERRAWRAELDNGVTLRLGQRELEARVARFAAVWPATLADRGEAVAAVDLRYTRGVAVAWHGDDPGPAAAQPTDDGAGDV
jgi:cell division protein FtsQ